MLGIATRASSNGPPITQNKRNNNAPQYPILPQQVVSGIFNLFIYYFQFQKKFWFYRYMLEWFFPSSFTFHNIHLKLTLYEKACVGYHIKINILCDIGLIFLWFWWLSHDMIMGNPVSLTLFTKNHIDQPLYWLGFAWFRMTYSPVSYDFAAVPVQILETTPAMDCSAGQNYSKK